MVSQINREKYVNIGTTGGFFQKLLSQGKKISQIVSYIWLNEDRETAEKLHEYFKSGKHEVLEKLLFANKVERNDQGELTDEYKLLLKIFKAEHLPIFDPEDKGFFLFRVTIDKFEGSISDPSPSDIGSNGSRLLVLTIPYPVPPAILNDLDCSDETPQTGFALIKKSELITWLGQDPNVPPYFNDNNPYIVASSS